MCRNLLVSNREDVAGSGAAARNDATSVFRSLSRRICLGEKPWRRRRLHLFFAPSKALVVGPFRRGSISVEYTLGVALCLRALTRSPLPARGGPARGPEPRAPELRRAPRGRPGRRCAAGQGDPKVLALLPGRIAVEALEAAGRSASAHSLDESVSRRVKPWRRRRLHPVLRARRSSWSVTTIRMNYTVGVAACRSWRAPTREFSSSFPTRASTRKYVFSIA